MGQSAKVVMQGDRQNRSVLMDRLQMLARPAPHMGDASYMALVGVDLPIPATLQLIDETVLPRDWLLETDRGQSVCLRVSNRRLVSVTRPDSNTPSCPEPNDPDDAARLFSSELSRVLDGTRIRKVHSHRIAEGDALDQMGCRAERLAKELGVDLAQHSVNNPFEHFAGQVQELASAWVMIDENGAIQDQSTAAQTQLNLTALVSMSDAFAFDRTSRSALRSEQPDCLLVPSDDDGFVLLAKISTQRCIARITSAQAGLVMGFWAEQFQPAPPR